MRDYIQEYWDAIKSGEIVVCNKVFKQYEHLVQLKNNEIQTEYFYNEKRAEKALRFIMFYCRQSKGIDGGKRINLLLWQKAMICAIFGFVDVDGYRLFRDLFLVVARKCGKTTLASAISLYMLYADGEAGAEIYSVATTREQAKLSWEEAKKMIRKSPDLSSKARTLVGEIVTDFNDGKFRPLASDSNTLDGLNPSSAIMDEVAMWVNGQPLYDVIVDGESARTQPLNIMITTAGTVREDIFDTLYERAEKVINGYSSADDDAFKDERFLPLIYELDSRAEWTDEDAWIKANPSIDAVKSREALRYKVEKAKQNPMLVRNLLCKDFNIRETSSEAWLTFEQLNNEDTFVLDKENRKLIWTPKDEDPRELSYPRYAIGGCDLSSSVDLTSAKVIFQVPEVDNIFVLQMYWIPEELIEKKVNEDKIPYDKWIDRGLCRVSTGNNVHYKFVKQWFVEVQENLDIFIPWIGYDSWSARYFVEDMQGYFGQNSMIAVHQGKKTLSDPMKRLGNDLDSKRIIYNNNPIDKWCLANTAYEEDKNGNIQPHKTSKSTRRIDGTASLLDAYVIFQEKHEDYKNMI